VSIEMTIANVITRQSSASSLSLGMVGGATRAIVSVDA
jgi:hypothetical protein